MDGSIDLSDWNFSRVSRFHVFVSVGATNYGIRKWEIVTCPLSTGGLDSQIVVSTSRRLAVTDNRDTSCPIDTDLGAKQTSVLSSRSPRE